MNRTRLERPNRIVVIGSVGSTERVLRGLMRLRAPVVGVMGLDRAVAGRVSGFVDLVAVGSSLGIESKPFVKINDSASVVAVDEWQPDLIFAVGLSQILGLDYIAPGKCPVIGFHPTRLPRGRGRAPLAWIVLGRADPAATFFIMDEGADSGPIIHQIDIDPGLMPSAETLAEAVHDAIDVSLDQWVPDLLAGRATAAEQDHSQATILGKRVDADGLIDWTAAAYEVDRLVRAATRPHPGAFSYSNGVKLRIWRSSCLDESRYSGVVGRVVAVEENGAPLLQCGSGILRIDEMSDSDGRPVPLGVGMQLGMSAESRMFDLENRIRGLEDLMSRRLPGHEEERNR